MSANKPGTGITCPKCGKETGVTETRGILGGLRRRRRCLDWKCDGRLSTVEVPKDRLSSANEYILIPRSMARQIIKMAISTVGIDVLRAMLEPKPDESEPEDPTVSPLE